MSNEILLDDLKQIVAYLSSDRFRTALDDGDAPLAARSIHVIAQTLDEMRVKIDPDLHMLRTSEARAIVGFLRSKYRGRAKDAAGKRKFELARAAINARADLEAIGDKVTESRIAQAADTDPVYVAALQAETFLAELSEHFETLWDSLHDRLEVLIEISRNARALMKGQE